MAKKKAPRRAARAARKPVRKAARQAAKRARTAIKKVARRAVAARKTARTAMKTAAKTTAKTTASMKKVATRQMKAATKQVKAARKQVQATTNKIAAMAKEEQKAASTAMGKAVTLAKAVKAGVTAALTPPAPPAKPSARAAKGRPKHPPSLDRTRRTVEDIHGVPSSLGGGPIASAANSGREEMKHKLQRHTSSSPALTAGDVDADWESADSSGDEAPGGDNPTPDQDVVDEIGRALGVEYEDDEELQGGDEIADRDRHRWELDPSSAEDTEDRD